MPGWLLLVLLILISPVLFLIGTGFIGVLQQRPVAVTLSIVAIVGFVWLLCRIAYGPNMKDWPW